MKKTQIKKIQTYRNKIITIPFSKLPKPACQFFGQIIREFRIQICRWNFNLFRDRFRKIQIFLTNFLKLGVLFDEQINDISAEFELMNDNELCSKFIESLLTSPKLSQQFFFRYTCYL